MIPFIAPPWVELPKIHIEQDTIEAKMSHKQLLQSLGIDSVGYWIEVELIKNLALLQSNQVKDLAIFQSSLDRIYTTLSTMLSSLEFGWQFIWP